MPRRSANTFASCRTCRRRREPPSSPAPRGFDARIPFPLVTRILPFPVAGSSRLLIRDRDFAELDGMGELVMAGVAIRGQRERIEPPHVAFKILHRVSSVWLQRLQRRDHLERALAIRI